MIRSMQNVTIRGVKYGKGVQFRNLQEDIEKRLFDAHKIFYKQTLIQIYIDIYGWSKDKAWRESNKQMNLRFQ